MMVKRPGVGTAECCQGTCYGVEGAVAMVTSVLKGWPINAKEHRAIKVVVGELGNSATLWQGNTPRRG